MNPPKPEEAAVHECHQKERLDQFHDAMFGAKGILTRFAGFEARMETKMSFITKQNWMLLTLWMFTAGGVAIKFIFTK